MVPVFQCVAGPTGVIAFHMRTRTEHVHYARTEGAYTAPKRTMNIVKRWLPLGVVVIIIAAIVVYLQEQNLLVGLVFVSYLALWMAFPRSGGNRK